MKAKLIGGLLTAFALAVITGAGAWYFLIRGDAPPPVSLAEAIAAANRPASDAGTATTVSSGNESVGADSGLAGEWVLVDSSQSFVGYRVNEQLAGIGSTTAVGRTASLDGTLSFDGEAITDAKVTADLSALASDKSMRDNALRNQALETASYPSASFALTTPIAVDVIPADGQTVTQTIQGDLTLHGVTRPVELEVQGVLQNGKLVVVGSTDIEFADYGINQPKAAAVLAVEDHGTLELQLIFEKAA